MHKIQSCLRHHFWKERFFCCPLQMLVAGLFLRVIIYSPKHSVLSYRLVFIQECIEPACYIYLHLYICNDVQVLVCAYTHTYTNI